MKPMLRNNQLPPPKETPQTALENGSKIPNSVSWCTILEFLRILCTPGPFWISRISLNYGAGFVMRGSKRALKVDMSHRLSMGRRRGSLKAVYSFVL
jgi:hypothetical protein